MHLTLTLVPPGTELLSGLSLKSPGGLEAGLTITDTHVAATIALTQATVAELRWLVDGVVRRVAKLAAVKSVSLVTRGAATAAADAVALDLRHRFGVLLEHDRGDALDALGDAEDLYRAWIDEDPQTRTSIAIADDITAWGEEIAKTAPVTVEVFDQEALEALGMNLLLAVGGSSPSSPPRLVIAQYTPESSLEPWMLVGKGITFDTGGINVKPYESFVSMMKNDMGGAALAWASFKYLVETGHPRPLTLVIPTCENAVGELAMRPGSVYKSHRGPTVRVDHTDAEGRLILADALSYATQRFDPARVLTFATLTTAALIAYGPYATPVHFASERFKNTLRETSGVTGEDVHFFDRRVWHFEANRDEEADLRNTARLPGHASRGAGSRNAAHFLLHFTDAPLTHFDIFASTWNWAGDAPGSSYGATGAPLRTLVGALTAMATAALTAVEP
ncbi:MAG: leucyl aminopeptidase [Myxococcota bacterium]|jgi:leucyl aminopeptidase